MSDPKEPLYKPEDAREEADIEENIEADTDQPGIPTSKDSDDVIPENIRDDGIEIPESRSVAEPVHMRDESPENSDLKHEDDAKPA